MNLDMYFRGYAKVDLDAVYNNVVELKKCLKDNTGIAAVIKTDGYGHGAVPIAKTIEELVDAYAVATVFEGINLIKHGMKKPIMLLGYTNEATYDLAIENNINMVVFNYEMALAMNNHARRMGKVAKVNIAIDTGMSRIGFLPNQEAIEDICHINKLDSVEINGIFTHFVSSDSKDKTLAEEQYKVYREFLEQLNTNGVSCKTLHCANSAAIMELPYTSLDLSRAGIAIYGLYPSDEVDRDNIKLTPALSLYSQVIHVKTIKSGQGVSYGHTYYADKDTDVATIPLGYGDGYFRNLSNKGYVIINGVKVPIIGRVCMDQFMVDVTGLDAKVGDKVTLIGQDGDCSITVEELADWAGTFNYELVCDLGKRIPRVYYRNGEIVCTKDYHNDFYEVK